MGLERISTYSLCLDHMSWVESCNADSLHYSQTYAYSFSVRYPQTNVLLDVDDGRSIVG